MSDTMLATSIERDGSITLRIPAAERKALFAYLDKALDAADDRSPGRAVALRMWRYLRW